MAKRKKGYRRVYDEATTKKIKYKEGIEVELTDEEVEQYKAGGYILEEMHEGGEPGHDHKDPPSYEDAMQAYKDSIAARAAYEDQYKLDLAQYEKDSADLKKRNVSYNRKLNAYNKSQDRYDRNQEYLRWLKAKYPTFPTYDEVYDSTDPSKGIYYYEHMTDSGETQRPEFPRGSLDKKSGDRQLYLSPYYKDIMAISPGGYSSEDVDRLNLDWDDIDEFTNKYLSKQSGPERELSAYNEFIDWGLGGNSGDLPIITMLAPPNIKKPKPLEEQVLEAVEYNPPEELERPNFADYVDPMPVIKPELTVDASLPEELEERDEVEGIDYEIKRGPYIQPGSGFLELQKGFVGTAGRTGRRLRYKGPRLKFGKRIVPIENELEYPEGFVPKFQHGGPHDPPNVVTSDERLANLKAAYEAEVARASDIMKNAHELGLKLGTNELDSRANYQPAKGYFYEPSGTTEDGETDYSLVPREVLINNTEDWNAIGMDFINDPMHWINNIKRPSLRGDEYLTDWTNYTTDSEGNRQYEYVLDENGDPIPYLTRGQGCVGAMCGIYSTAGATNISDYKTGTGKITKAGDPIFKQMSNAFWDANDEAALTAAGFEKVKEGDPIRKGTLARVRKTDEKGNVKHSHTAMVNALNEDGTAVDFNNSEGFIENPGSFYTGIRTSKPYSQYDLDYYNYVGDTKKLKKEYDDFSAEVEERRKFNNISRLPLIKPELTKRETPSGIPKIIKSEGSDKPKRNKLFSKNKRMKQQGGSIEAELTDKEVEQYKANGYVLEELPSYEPGGANDSTNPLTEWANQQQSLWEGLYEYNPEGRDLATGYFQNIGDKYNLNLIQKGKMPHWSAATVSNAVMANIGATDKQTAQQLGFNPTASHSGYVRDAFKAAADPKYKYNRYVAEKPDGNYGIGDILVKGRRDGKNTGTSKWSYKNFANTDKSYVSHGDIIVDKGEDDKGQYVVLAGGNLGDTYKNKKVYTKNIASKYKVKLKDNKKDFKMGAAPTSASKATAPVEKFNNVGEDVTVNSKRRSLFKNNFDSDIENDQPFNQEFDETSYASMPPASNFSGSLVPNQQAALFGDNTLGIGYVPYQYQFPEYLGRPQEEEMLDESYETPYENILDDTDSDVVNPDSDIDPNVEDEDNDIESNVVEDLSNITEKELEQLNDEDLEKHSYNKLNFKPKPVKLDKFEKKALSKEAKTEIQRLEDEINNLKRSPIERANEISKQIKSLEEFGDETLNERKALAKERVRLLLAIQEGAVTKGTEIDDQIKELRGQIESIKLGESAYAVESGKITETKYYDNYHPGFNEAVKTLNKKMEDGFVWVSWNRNISDDELYKRGYPEVILESLDNYQTNDWRPNVAARSNQKSDIYKSSLTDNEDVRFIEDYYGDGSSKYGQWIKADDLGEAGGFTDRTLNPQNYNDDGVRSLESMEPYNPLPQSGRAAMFYPELNAIFGPLWGTLGLGSDLVSDERTVQYQEGPPDFIDQMGTDIGDALWSLKPYYFMDDLEKSRYRNMKSKRSAAGHKNTFERTPQALSDGAQALGDGAKWIGEKASDAWDWMTDWQDGGSIPKIDEGYVVDLNEEEALAYARKGYIVEEIK